MTSNLMSKGPKAFFKLHRTVQETKSLVRVNSEGVGDNCFDWLETVGLSVYPLQLYQQLVLLECNVLSYASPLITPYRCRHNF
jgi:hypothetical protein